MARKRTSCGDAVKHSLGRRSLYATDYLPHPWLSKYEDEPPGYIRAVEGDLNRCFIKKQIEKPVYGFVQNANGARIKKLVGKKKVFIWKHVS